MTMCIFSVRFSPLTNLQSLHSAIIRSKPVLGGYHKYLQASLGIPVSSPQGVITSDGLTENRHTGSHVCEPGCENLGFFLKI